MLMNVHVKKQNVNKLDYSNIAKLHFIIAGC